MLDRNRDGIIEASELHNVLKTALRTRKNTTDRQIRRLIESLDKDGDGRVDLDDISLLKDKIIVSFFFFLPCVAFCVYCLSCGVGFVSVG